MRLRERKARRRPSRIFTLLRRRRARSARSNCDVLSATSRRRARFFPFRRFRSKHRARFPPAALFPGVMSGAWIASRYPRAVTLPGHPAPGPRARRRGRPSWPPHLRRPPRDPARASQARGPLEDRAARRSNREWGTLVVSRSLESLGESASFLFFRSSDRLFTSSSRASAS